MLPYPTTCGVLTRDEFMAEERHFWQDATPIGFIFRFGLVIGVIVGMVICSQVLQADVASHLKEYATLKAMGYTSGYLTWVVLQEGLCLGVLGFVPSLIVCVFLYEQLAKPRICRSILDSPACGYRFRPYLLPCASSAGLLAVRKVQVSDPAEVF